MREPSYRDTVRNPGAEREVTNLDNAAECLLDLLVNDPYQQQHMDAYVAERFKRHGFEIADVLEEENENTPAAAFYWACIAEWYAQVLARAIISMTN